MSLGVSTITTNQYRDTTCDWAGENWWGLLKVGYFKLTWHKYGYFHIRLHSEAQDRPEDGKQAPRSWVMIMKISSTAQMCAEWSTHTFPIPSDATQSPVSHIFSQCPHHQNVPTHLWKLCQHPAEIQYPKGWRESICD